MADDRGLLGTKTTGGAAGPSEPGPATVESGRGPLRVEQILAWADAHHATHGAWPNVRLMTGLGRVEGAPGESWKAINHALVFGLRGLPGDSSLAELLAEQRGVPMPEMGSKALAEKMWEWEQEHFPVKGPRRRLPDQPREVVRLTLEKILTWADAHRVETGKWPTVGSGRVLAANFEVTWTRLNDALKKGRHGLPGGSSLTGLLAEHCDFRTPLTIERILAWADDFHTAHGRWPGYQDKAVAPALGETWYGIDQALRQGRRGLAGGSSLTRLLVAHRGPDADSRPPELTVEQILGWADDHFAAKGCWPVRDSGAIAQAPAETWGKMELALRQVGRGLKEKSTLASLLETHRGVRNRSNLPDFTVEQILAWADDYHATTGRWPTPHSGPVAAAPGENWAAIQSALCLGNRGLPGGATLPQLLAYRKPAKKPDLTVKMIRAWAVEHQEATGIWPNSNAGPVAGVPGERWWNLNRCLRTGRRGLPGGTNLKEVLGPRAKRPHRRKR